MQKILKNQTKMSKTKKKELNNVVGYIISKQKSIAFLYTVNEYMHIEIENTVPFIKLCYLGVNLTKYT